MCFLSPIDMPMGGQGWNESALLGTERVSADYIFGECADCVGNVNIYSVCVVWEFESYEKDEQVVCVSIMCVCVCMLCE